MLLMLLLREIERSGCAGNYGFLSQFFYFVQMCDFQLVDGVEALLPCFPLQLLLVLVKVLVRPALVGGEEPDIVHLGPAALVAAEGR